MFRPCRAALWPCVLALCASLPAGAQPAAPPPPPQQITLKQAFEMAWLRQPEAASSVARQEAAEAGRRAAQSWTAEPPTLELLARTDRLNANGGQREYEAGVAVPLWLPGERGRAGQLAEAALNAGSARVGAAQLKLAAGVREAWWAFQRAALENEVARERLSSARQLAADVGRRVRAGDLARADQFQADSAVAQAEAALAEAAAGQQAAGLALRAWLGTPALPPLATGTPQPEAMPAVPADLGAVEARHPALADLLARAELGRRAAELALVQRRANPELVVATARERGQFGETYQQNITVGIRFPFGGGSRADAKAASARAEALEADSQAQLERARLLGDIEAALARVGALRVQREAAEKRAHLARELRGFFDKSFRLGETDLPSRLRAEQEATEAERQAARTRIEAAAAVSALRQALGLLPE